MLLHHQWAVLTVEEARLLMQYIEKSTATKTMPRNYDKIGKAGLSDIYNKLREFVECNTHYESNLRYLDPGDFVTRDY